MSSSIFVVEKMKNKEVWLNAVKHTGCALVWFIAGVLLSATVFGDGFAWHFVLCAAMPLLWLRTPTRVRAWLLSFGYYLGAAHDVPAGSTVFFGFEAQALGIVLWLAASLVLSLPWAVFWTRFDLNPDETPIGCKQGLQQKIIRLSLALLFVTIPPIGVFGWANPVMGFAWFPFFTGSGFLGIVLGIIITAVIAQQLANYRTGYVAVVYRALTVLMFALLFMFNSCPSKDAFNKMAEDCLGARGVYTELGRPYSGSAGMKYDAQQLKEFLHKYVKVTDKDKIIVLPETIAGTIDEAKHGAITDFIRMSGNDNLIVFIGGQKILKDGSGRYENGIYCYTASGGVVGRGNYNYIQRFPVPISMWLPFGGEGTCAADWFGSSILRIGEQRAACLLCFEHVLAFPLLQSFARLKNRPTMILAVANKWWSRNTGIPAIQDQSVLTWARLFGVPVLTAENK